MRKHTDESDDDDEDDEGEKEEEEERLADAKYVALKRRGQN